MNALAQNPDDESGEIEMIAAEMADAYQRQVAFLRQHMHMDDQHAHLAVRGPHMTAEEVASVHERLVQCPPEQVHWLDLQGLAEHDPVAVVDVWRELKRQARDELEGGHRAAQAMDWQRRPWARARFIALREHLQLGSPPQTGVEAALYDLAAEAYSDYLEHTEQWHRMMSAEAEVERGDLDRTGKWSVPRRIVAEAIADAERRKDAAHNRFLRTVKMLHELQRSKPALYVAKAGQINVDQQQVNMTTPRGKPHGDDDDLPE
jgi:hypothetical protein